LKPYTKKCSRNAGFLLPAPNVPACSGTNLSASFSFFAIAIRASAEAGQAGKPRSKCTH
jgi:hypothetical protein